MRRTAIALLLLVLYSAACLPAPGDVLEETGPDEIATIVAATLGAAQPAQPQPPSKEPTGQPSPTAEAIQEQNGTVAGNVCYPSEFIPAMNLYFQETTTNAVTEIPIPENQGAFSVELAPGTYHAYAWLPDFSGSGSYSQAVPCGLQVGCTDHSLIPINVAAGQAVQGIEVCDWYHGPYDVPYPPNVDVNAITGAISGSLSYPSEGIPALTVVAFEKDKGFWYYVDTLQNASTYTIDNLPPGTYQVVAYNAQYNIAGGYTQAVPCGLSVNCTDHSLISVAVAAGQTVTGIDPADWYAPANAFPPNPVP